LDWLRDQARRHYNIVEVGAWKGRVTDALASSTGGHVTVVDAWAGSTDPSDDTAYLDAEKAFEEYIENVGGYRNITTYRGPSREAWRRLHHESFDMVWIDADHRYDAVREDILMWRSLLRKGGLLCGHDGQYADVARAVDELVPGAKRFETPQPGFDEPSVIWYSER
jgi:predicted O-methyltransferase YrrM